MKRKGFTLIELLAVIVVLAIIALIATPIVMNTIKNAKKGAAERSADNYVKTVEQKVEESRIDGTKIANGTYNIQPDGNLCSASGCGENDKDKITIDMSGNKPTSGTIIITNGEVQSSSRMILGDYSVEYNDDKCTATKIETYKITYKLTNVGGNNVTSITNVESKSLIFTTSEGYKLPLSVTVDGATSTWDKKTGTLVLSKVTGNVTVTLNGVVKTMCNAVDTATTGKVPQGQFAYGDEYICDLGDTEDSKNLTFFVLEDGDATTLTDGRIAQAGEVSLIMNKNLDGSVAWCSKKDYVAAGGTETDYGTYGNNNKGPLTATAALQNKTASWNKITDKTKITLPTAYQIATAAGKTFKGTSMVVGLPAWLKDYLRNSAHPIYSWTGYWTSTYYTLNSTRAWLGEYGNAILTNYVNVTGYYGVRPVITISKSNLS